MLLQASAEGDLSSTEASKKADEEYLAKLTNECTSKAGEWEERQKSAADELAALEKGSEILTAKFGFIQMSVTVADAEQREMKVVDVVRNCKRFRGRFDDRKCLLGLL